MLYKRAAARCGFVMSCAFNSRFAIGNDSNSGRGGAKEARGHVTTGAWLHRGGLSLARPRRHFGVAA